MLGEPEDMNVMQSLSFDGCGVNYIYQPVKGFPCGSEPDLIETDPDLTPIDVLTSVDIVDPVPPCDNICRYEWDANADNWVQTQTCDSGSGCTCASRELSRPGPGDPVVLEFPCDRDDGRTPGPGSLNFGRSQIEVCSAIDTSPYSIPLRTCPLPGEPY